jgi:hypothetical protein
MGVKSMIKWKRLIRSQTTKQNRASIQQTLKWEMIQIQGAHNDIINSEFSSRRNRHKCQSHEYFGIRNKKKTKPRMDAVKWNKYELY